jgi:hypothetical protein
VFVVMAASSFASGEILSPLRLERAQLHGSAAALK